MLSNEELVDFDRAARNCLSQLCVRMKVERTLACLVPMSVATLVGTFTLPGVTPSALAFSTAVRAAEDVYEGATSQVCPCIVAQQVHEIFDEHFVVDHRFPSRDGLAIQLLLRHYRTPEGER